MRTKTKREIAAYVQGVGLTLLLVNPTAYAAPTGGTVVGGTGTIAQSGTQTTINQATQNMAINWQSYNVNNAERVQYIQPNSTSVSLNRILGNDGSTIAGRIDANGQVILVNPNGVFFTPTAVLNVGGIIASGLDIKPDDFMNGNYIFSEVLGTDGGVINSGIINASLGGNVALLGRHVENNGLISANLGTVNLAAGKEAVLTFDNQGLLGVRVTKEILQNDLGVNPAVLNSGTIQAEGGKVLLTASVSKDVFSQAVNTNGIQSATSVVANGDGTFTLGGGADVVNTGTIDTSTTTTAENVGRIVLLGNNVTSSGKLKADAANGNGGEIEVHSTNMALLTQNSVTSARSESNGTGGIVKVLGDKVGLFDQSTVDVSGANGGGQALIGGDAHGANSSIRNASKTIVDRNVNLYADALQQGNGGNVIVWSDIYTQYFGSVYARGGAISGDGGFVETSGKINLLFDGMAYLGATNGAGGMLLLDPQDITISNNTSTSSGTADNSLLSTTSGSHTVAFDATPASATITKGRLETALDNAGTATTPATITLQATRDIIFASGANISTNNQYSNLTLLAGDDIYINSGANISIAGALNMTAGVASCGTATCDRGVTAGTENLLGNSIYINARIDTIGAVNLIAADNVTINQQIGNNNNPSSLTIRAGNDITISNTVVTAGNINLTASDNSLTTGTAVTASPSVPVTGIVSITRNVDTNSGDFTIGGDTKSFSLSSIRAITTLGGNISVGTSTNRVDSVTSNGTLDTTGADGVKGGDISIYTTGNIATNTITTTGGAAIGGTSGKGGSVLLDANGTISLNGAITTTGGAGTDSSGRRNGAIAGSVTATTTSTVANAITIKNNITATGGALAGTGASAGTQGNGNSVSFTGAVVLDASALTGQLVTIDTSGGNQDGSVTFNNTLDGTAVHADNLNIVTANNVWFSDNVGATTSIGNLSIANSLAGNGNAGSVNVGTGISTNARDLNAKSVTVTAVSGFSAAKVNTVGVGAAGGDVSVTLTGTTPTPSIDIQNIDTSGDSTGTFAGGNITLNAPTVSVGQLTTSGTGTTTAAAGTINIGNTTAATTVNLNGDITALGCVTSPCANVYINNGTVNDNYNGDFTSLVKVNGGGGSGDSIVSTIGTGNWSITGLNTGTMKRDVATTKQGLSFSGVENLTGADDDITIPASPIAYIDIFTFGASGRISGTIDGGSATGTNYNTIIGRDAASTWTIAGADATTGGGNNAITSGGSTYLKSFQNIQKLTGGSADDTFNFTASGSSISGAITDASSNNTISFSSLSSANARYFTVSSAGAGKIGTTSTATDTIVKSFSGIQNLEGGSGADSFEISGDMTSLKGGGGSDIFDINASGLTIASIDGGSGSDTLRGPDATNYWYVTSSGGNGATGTLDQDNLQGNGNPPTTTSSPVVAFSNIDVLTGGTTTGTNVNNFTVNSGATITTINGVGGADNFTINGTVTTINGGAGGDQFNLSGTVATVNGGAGTDTFTLGSSARITTLNGGAIADGDTLIGPNVANNTWTITGNNSGSLTNGGATTYVNSFNTVQNLQGGNLTDNFTIGASGTFNGSIDGGAVTAGTATTYNTLTASSNINNTWTIGVLGATSTPTATNNLTYTRSTTNYTTTFLNVTDITGGSNTSTPSSGDTFTVNSTSATSGVNTITTGNGSVSSVTVASTGSLDSISTGTGTNTIDISGSLTNATTGISGANTGSNTIHVYSTGSVAGAIDYASATTGKENITIDASGKVSGQITTGGADDIILINGTSGAISTGSGNDDITLGAAGIAHTAGVTYDVDGGDGTLDKLTISTGNNTWNITNLTTGTGDVTVTGSNPVVSTTFTRIEQHGGSTAGNDFINLSSLADGSTVSLTDFSGFGVLIGNANLRLQGYSGNTDWTIEPVIDPRTSNNSDGTNDGTVMLSGSTITTRFIDFGHLLGGGGIDTFTVKTGGLILGGNFPSTGTTFVAGIDGGGGTNKIIGLDIANTWTISGANAGTIAGTTGGTKYATFSGIQQLQGAATNNDAFMFQVSAATANFSQIDGGGQTTSGLDKIDFSLYSGGAVSLNLASNGFLNIEEYVGNNNTASEFIGTNNTNTWDINNNPSVTTTAVNSVTWTPTGQTSANVVYFSGFPVVTGGTAVDTFNVNSGANINTINGSLGADVFNIKSGATVTTLNGNGTTLTGTDGNDTFTIDGTVLGAIHGNDGNDQITINATANLGSDTNGYSIYGDNGDDTVTVASGATISGIISGGTDTPPANPVRVESDTITFASNADITLGATTTPGGYSVMDDFEVIGAVNGTLRTVDGRNNTWNITGLDSGSVIDSAGKSLRFTGFSYLIGSNPNGGGQNGNDTFSISGDGSVSGYIDAKGGNNYLDINLTATRASGQVYFMSGTGTDGIYIYGTSGSGRYDTGFTLTGQTASFDRIQYTGTNTPQNVFNIYYATNYNAAAAAPDTLVDAVNANMTFNGRLFVADTYGLSTKSVNQNTLFTNGVNGNFATFSLNSLLPVSFSNKSNVTVNGGTVLLGAANDTLTLGDITLPTTTTLNLNQFSQVSQTGINPLSVGTLSLSNITQATTLSTTIGTLSVASSGGVTINETNGLTIDQLSTSNPLTITSASGNVDSSATGTRTSTGAITISTPGDIALSGTLSGSLTLNGGTSVNVTNATATALGGVNTSSLTITSTGDITQTGAVVVSGTTQLSAVGFDIKLDSFNATSGMMSLANDFNVINVSAANNAQFSDINSINGGSITASNVQMHTTTGVTGLQTSTPVLNITNIGTGPITVTNTGEMTQLTLQTKGNIDYTNNAGGVTIDMINANYGQPYNDYNYNANVVLTVPNGNVSGFGQFDVSTPDIVARKLAVYQNTASIFGNTGRYMYLDVDQEFALFALRGYVTYYGGLHPQETGNASLVVFSGLAALSGQQLIDLETLAQIDPAIFTAVRNYYYEDVAIAMPEDQRLTDDDDKERKKRRGEPTAEAAPIQGNPDTDVKQ